MEGNHGQPPLWIQSWDRLLQHLPNRPQLIIDCDSNCLKAALGRMLLFPQGLSGQSPSDHIHQLKGCFNGRILPLPVNGPGDLRCIALFPIFIENPAKLFPGPLVDHVIGRQPILPIHTHIQRRIRHIGKAALAIIQLRGRNTEVEEHPVHLLDSKPV